MERNVFVAKLDSKVLGGKLRDVALHLLELEKEYEGRGYDNAGIDCFRCDVDEHNPTISFEIWSEK